MPDFSGCIFGIKDWHATSDGGQISTIHDKKAASFEVAFLLSGFADK